MSVNDLPRMMADAMHGARQETAADWAAAEVDFRAKLDEMVDAGMPETLDPLTLEEQARLNAGALRRGVVQANGTGKTRDIGEWLAQVGIELRLIDAPAGPRFWTIGNAAKSIAAQVGLDATETDALLEKMMNAASKGELEALDPHQEQSCWVDSQRDWYYRTTQVSVNNWLDSVNAAYRWGASLDFPVSNSLEPWFKTSLDRLPEAIRVTLANKALPGGWDGWTGMTEEDREVWRRSWAAQYDAQHDPARHADRVVSWEAQSRLQELEDAERALQLMRVDDPLQQESRQRQLSAIDEERRELGAKVVTLCRRVQPDAPGDLPTEPTAVESALAAPVVENPLLTRTHKAGSRADPLAAVITVAEQRALDATDWTSVWASLVVLAQSAPRPAPLLGYAEGEGVQYQVDDAGQPAGYLTRDAFRKRFKRRG